MKTTIKERTAEMLRAALDLANVTSWQALTHDSIARKAGVSASLVKVRLGSIATVRQAVMREAVKQRVVRVVAEGLAVRNRTARRADASLRAECGEWVAGA